MDACHVGLETERRNSSTAKLQSMDAHNHRLSDQVGQLQSKLDKAAFHGDLIAGMEVDGTPEKGPSSEWLPEWASRVQTAAGNS